MKRSIPFLLAIVAIGAASLAFLKNDSSPEYQPRVQETVSGATGAEEIRKSMLVDPLTGEINLEYVSMVESDLKKYSRNDALKNTDLEWVSAGPNNVGGRTRGIFTYPDNPDRVFIGAVSGGLFQSFNGGEEWERVDGFNDNLSVSSVTKAGNGNLYAGTGHWREDFRGNGVYVSTDDGNTWASVPEMAPASIFANSVWTTINVLAPDANDPDKIWVGNAGGLYSYDSSTGAATEILTFSCPSISISEDGQTIVANSGNRVYVSSDGGQTFDNRSGSGFGQVPTTNIGRMEVAVSPDDPNFMYAIQVTPYIPASGDVPDCAGHMKGFYASTDGGVTWTELYGSSGGVGGNLPFVPFVNPDVNCQGLYDCAITVVPGSPDKVIIGGIRMYIIELLGTTPPSSQWSSLNVNFANGPNPLYVHSDIHIFHWDANDEFYIGCDGGIFKSFDYAESFVPANYNYRSTQFYGIDYANSGAVLGGTQDNGTHIISGYNISNNDSDEINGGDGFDCGISKFQSSIAFGTSQNGNVFRTFDGGLSGGEFLTHTEPQPFWTVIDHHEVLDANNAVMQDFSWSPVYLTAGDTYQEGDTLFFTEDTCFDGVSYVAGDTLVFEDEFIHYYLPPNASHPYTGSNYNIQYTYTNETGENLYINCPIPAPDPAQTLFCYGSTGRFQFTRDAFKNTVAGGDVEWVNVTGISGTVISFEFSPDGDKIYAGTTSGRVYRIDGLSNAFTLEEMQEAANNKTTIYTGSGNIRDMAIDYNNPNRLAICKPGYSTIAHVLISDEAGTTTNDDSFEDAWNPPGHLGLMPVYSVQFDITTPNRIFAGTEYGTWVSEDLGQNWTECNTNMGRVPVYALEQQELTQSDLIPGSPEVILNEGAMYAGTYGRGIFYIGDYILGVNDFNDNESIIDLNIFPNPLSTTGTLKLNLAQNADIRIEIIDITGKMIQSLPQGLMQRGEHFIEFGVSTYPEGTYLLNVISDGQAVETGRFVIAK